MDHKETWGELRAWCLRSGGHTAVTHRHFYNKALSTGCETTVKLQARTARAPDRTAPREGTAILIGVPSLPRAGILLPSASPPPPPITHSPKSPASWGEAATGNQVICVCVVVPKACQRRLFFISMRSQPSETSLSLKPYGFTVDLFTVSRTLLVCATLGT